MLDRKRVCLYTAYRIARRLRTLGPVERRPLARGTYVTKTAKALIVLGALALVLLVAPFLVPVPPLEDTVDPRELAGPDSQFVGLQGIDVHTVQRGEGEPLLVLLHGFGASVFSWREVIEPLAAYGTVVAYDRPAFGLTERPMRDDWSGRNPYTPAFQVDLTLDLIDAMGAERAILVGNSAGGTIAALTALTHPERVEALILVSPAIYTGGGAPAFVRPLLSTPQLRHLGPLIARRIRGWGTDLLVTSWHDPSAISEEIMAGYERPLQADNWDRALWELTAASRSSAIDERLDELTLPVLVIAGDDDRVVPTQESIRLAGELPNAELAVLPACGHVPQEECPGPFLEETSAFLAALADR
ncbi:MAG: alpha/beta hydrolase [Anaerolineae bacterium]|nr:alpha/beta hydrolase [Anaerolineae bacterium]